MDVGTQLLEAGATILREASEYHDRAMTLLDYLEPPDNSPLDLTAIGSPIDLSDWLIQEEPSIPVERSARQKPVVSTQKATPPTLEALRALAGDDEPSRWVPRVKAIVEAEGVIGFEELVQQSGLSIVQVWIALLFSGLRMERRGDFYQGELVVLPSAAL